MAAAGRAVSHFFRVCWNRPALALGLRVVRAAVFLGHAQSAQLGFQAVAAAAAAGQPGGVDQAVEFLSGVKQVGA